MAEPSELRTAVRLLDGPEAGGTILGYKGEPPDEIVVFRTQMLAAGTLVCGPVDGTELLSGDLIYRKVSRSSLLDNPDFKAHPNVMAGCAYKFVRAVPVAEVA
jgi:hypothetical protein